MSKLKPWPIGPQDTVDIEGAIAYMEKMRSICDTDDGLVPQVYDMAIAALRRVAPGNEPLTLEQLRQMDRRSVYCDVYSTYVLLFTDEDDCLWVTFPNGDRLTVKSCINNASCNFYRRKPEGSENNAKV